MGNTSGGGHRRKGSLDTGEPSTRLPMSQAGEHNSITDDPVFSILTCDIETNALADRLRGASAGTTITSEGRDGNRPLLYTGLDSDDNNDGDSPAEVPTFFKWEGGGKEVFISGSFTGWKSKIPLVRSSSKNNFYIMLDLPVGEYQYKFIVDGQWKVDKKQTTTTSPNGLSSNVIEVRKSDRYFLNALLHDMSASAASSDPSSPNTPTTNTNTSQGSGQHPNISPAVVADFFDEGGQAGGGSYSPPGSYSSEIPRLYYSSSNAASSQDQRQRTSSGSSSSSTKSATSRSHGHHHHQTPADTSRKSGKTVTHPPSLPPQLNQVILNRDTPSNCDPNLLPQPGHTMLNHMYALSITVSGCSRRLIFSPLTPKVCTQMLSYEMI